MFYKIRSITRAVFAAGLLASGGFTGQFLEDTVNYELGLTVKAVGAILAALYVANLIVRSGD